MPYLRNNVAFMKRTFQVQQQKKTPFEIELMEMNAWNISTVDCREHIEYRQCLFQFCSSEGNFMVCSYFKNSNNIKWSSNNIGTALSTTAGYFLNMQHVEMANMGNDWKLPGKGDVKHKTLGQGENY